MTEETRDETTENKEGTQGKTWYPYITKTQFEKFLVRLESKMPEQVDRDYIRAIIRTPSMIYRFLRGIEAMKLIDREQKPSERLKRLVAQESRKHTIAEILRDLYADLLEEWQESNGSMSDDDIVSVFRSKTGMGRDSANKMKMFFKYLIGEADFSEPPPRSQEPPRQPSSEVTVEAEPRIQEQQAPAKPEPAPAKPEPAPAKPEPAPVKPEPAPAKPEPAPAKLKPAPAKLKPAPAKQVQDRRPSRDSRPAPSAQRNGPQQADQSQRGLSETQKAYLQTLQTIVSIKIDGDWDDDMIRAAFDRLERLFDRIKRI